MLDRADVSHCSRSFVLGGSSLLGDALFACDSRIKLAGKNSFVCLLGNTLFACLFVRLVAFCRVGFATLVNNNVSWRTPFRLFVFFNATFWTISFILLVSLRLRRLFRIDLDFFRVDV